MNKQTIRHGAEYVGYRTARWLIGSLPLSAVRWLGKATGLLYFLLGREHRQRALTNLRNTLPTQGTRHRTIARRCFQSYGAIFFETAHAYGREPDRFQDAFEVEGWEHLEAAQALGRGCFLVAGHFGNWELALWPLGRRLGKIHVVARPLTNPWVERDVVRLRSRLGHAMLPGKAAVFRMRNVLRDGGCVAIAIDQRVRPRNGTLIPFLGRPAWLTPTVAALSIRTGTPVVPVFCSPEGRNRYKIVLQRPILPAGHGLDAEAAMTRRCLEPLEREIRARPELWLWMHRLWRLTQQESKPEPRALNRRVSGIESTEPMADSVNLPEDLREEVRRLVGSTFLERAENAVIVTSWDAGTLAARNIAEAFLAMGHRLRLATPRQITQELTAARHASELARAYRELDICDLLILHGLGREPLDSDQLRELVELLEQRRGRRSVLVTTQVAIDAWEQIFGDVATARSVRRNLVGNSIMLTSSRRPDRADRPAMS